MVDRISQLQRRLKGLVNDLDDLISRHAKEGGSTVGVEVRGEALGALLKKLRDELDLTNQELADAAGISVGTMSQILNGAIICPPISRLEGLASLLGVSVDTLITEAEKDGCTYE